MKEQGGPRDRKNNKEDTTYITCQKSRFQHKNRTFITARNLSRPLKFRPSANADTARQHPPPLPQREQESEQARLRVRASVPRFRTRPNADGHIYGDATGSATTRGNNDHRSPRPLSSCRARTNLRTHARRQNELWRRRAGARLSACPDFASACFRFHACVCCAASHQNFTPPPLPSCVCPFPPPVRLVERGHKLGNLVLVGLVRRVDL